MKLAKWSVVAVAVVLFVACRGHEQSVAGTYGMSSASGQVVMTTGGTPAGVTVTVRGTGQTQLLGEDGRFSFAGLPEDVQLIFTRADGINATYRPNGMTGSVIVELSANGAHGRTRSAPSSPHGEFEGAVQSVSATQLVIIDAHRGNTTFTLDAHTVITKGGATVQAADLKSGDRVHVTASKQSDDTLLALFVTAQNTSGHNETAEFEGIVKAIAADSITLTTPGGDVTLGVDSSTTFQPAAPSVGDRVHVRAAKTADGLVATLVRVQGSGGDDDPGDDHGEHGGTTMTANGKVTATGGDTITVDSESHGSVTVKVDAQTIIRKQGATIGVAGITSGDFVNAMGTKIDDHSLLARQIEVRGENGHK